MFERALEDWFYVVKQQRPALEAAALAAVTRWVWFKGTCNPLNPEPWFWQRRGFPVARQLKKPPAATPAARKNHLECGLDAEGRLLIERQFWGGAEPYTRLYGWSPRAIRSVRFSYDDYRFTPPETVVELTLRADGRVTTAESYGNLSLWPSDRDLTAADIARLKKAEPFQLNRYTTHFTWKGERLVGTDDGVEFEFEGDAPVRLWRKNHTRPNGEETLWAPPRAGWPYVAK